jgi:CTP synthase
MRTKDGSLMRKIYGNEIIRERHRHRYEVNISYIEEFESRGLVFSTTSLDGILPEAVELSRHRFFVGVQFHPELTSRPFAPNPLFKSFVENCL